MKSAYRLWCDDQLRRSTNRSGAVSAGASSLGRMGEEEKLWADIWSLNCPNRLKHFIWRFAHNSLALRSNLDRRGMKTGDRCVMCDKIGEDGGHAFFRCKQVKELWRCTGQEAWRQKLAACYTATEVISTILQIRDDNQLRILFLLCNWWHERNAVREGEKRRMPDQIASLSWKQALEVKNLYNPPRHEGAARGRQRKWQRPQAGRFKINVDGAFRSRQKWRMGLYYQE